MNEIDYNQAARDFAFGQVYRGYGYTLNLQQLVNHSNRMAEMYSLPGEYIYDKLISETKKLDAEGYNPMDEIEKFLTH